MSASQAGGGGSSHLSRSISVVSVSCDEEIFSFPAVAAESMSALQAGTQVRARRGNERACVHVANAPGVGTWSAGSR